MLMPDGITMAELTETGSDTQINIYYDLIRSGVAEAVNGEKRGRHKVYRLKVAQAERMIDVPSEVKICSRCSGKFKKGILVVKPGNFVAASLCWKHAKFFGDYK